VLDFCFIRSNNYFDEALLLPQTNTNIDVSIDRQYNYAKVGNLFYDRLIVAAATVAHG
jgi:hypothetical protein